MKKLQLCVTAMCVFAALNSANAQTTPMKCEEEGARVQAALVQAQTYMVNNVVLQGKNAVLEARVKELEAQMSGGVKEDKWGGKPEEKGHERPPTSPQGESGGQELTQ